MNEFTFFLACKKIMKKVKWGALEEGENEETTGERFLSSLSSLLFFER